ncbi:MAG: hypothetical protein FJ301_09310 [Planctomycetes bacterium]|nr:hypothetical protein [Planctomycetota bacterium]
MRVYLAVAALAAVPAIAVAQDAVAPQAPAARETDATARGRLGFDVTSQYFFRGIRQASDGLILQPWAEVGWSLIDGNDSLRGLELTLGTWNSLQSDTPNAADGSWYEGRGYIDLTASVGEKWTFGMRYTAYGNPNGGGTYEQATEGFGTVQEFAFRAQLDDRGYLGELIESGLQPYALLALETAGEREYYFVDPNSIDANGGVYAEFGITPSFNTSIGDDDLRLYVPIKLGLSVSDYYQDTSTGKDEHFGYLDVGVEIRQPLKFLPHRMGPWQAVVGLHFLLLGDNCEERNKSTDAPSVSGDELEFILNIGLSTSF